jgi:hypothetical protein
MCHSLNTQFYFGLNGLRRLALSATLHLRVPLSSESLHFGWKKHYSTIASNSRKALSVRMDDVAFPVAFMGINNPSPAIFCHRARIAPRPTGSAKLVSDDFPVFHWRHDARDSASPVQLNKIIEIRPFKGAGSALKRQAVSRTGPVRGRKMMPSVAPLRAQNSDAAKFACSITLATWSA